jgi:AraC-like DNA-binding protein
MLFQSSVKNFFFTVLFCLSLAGVGFAQLTSKQLKIDLELDSLQSLIISDQEKALTIIERLSKSDNTCLQYNAQYYGGFMLYHKDAYSDAKEILVPLLMTIKSNEQIFTRDCYLKLIYKTVNLLFFVEKNLGNYNKGLKLLEANEAFLDPDVLLFLYGTAHIGLGNYEEAIRLFKKDINEGYVAKRVQKSTSKNAYSRIMAQRFNALGDAYQKLFITRREEAILDSADYYYSRAVETIKPMDNIPEYTYSLLLLRKAKSYTLKDDYNAALNLYYEVATIPYILTKATENQVLDLQVADCLFKLGKMDSALFYANRFLEKYATKPTTKENLVTAYAILSQCYGAFKDNEKAYAFAQKNMELTKEMDKKNKEALEFIHNYNIKGIKEQYQSVVKAKNKKVQLLIIGGILLCLLLISYILYAKNRNGKRYQRFMEIIHTLPNKEIPLQTMEGVIWKTQQSSFEMQDELPKVIKPIAESEAITKIAEGLKKLEKSKDYLKADFKLAYVAKKLNTNTVYLSHYFNAILKHSFSDYVQNLRMEYVLTKLRDNNQFRLYTLQAIAEEIGYKNANTFVTVFKKTTGISPSFYIKELNKN